jgi:hypothetical protein
MPAKGSINATALPAQIVAWLTENAGEHRARDVAEGLGVPDGVKRADWSQKVANALGRLARDGSVKHQYRDLGYKRPTGVYSVPERT